MSLDNSLPVSGDTFYHWIEDNETLAKKITGIEFRNPNDLAQRLRDEFEKMIDGDHSYYERNENLVGFWEALENKFGYHVIRAREVTEPVTTLNIHYYKDPRKEQGKYVMAFKLEE